MFPRYFNLSSLPSIGQFCTNKVITSRYTLLTFLPINLWEQFHLASNVYYLCIGILQLFKEVSTTNGVPTLYLPLSFIMFVSALRAATEDYRRHIADEEENSKIIYSLNREATNLEFIKTKSESIIVGNIVKICNNQIFPADIVCLYSSTSKGFCFVETASIDGESGLKTKSAINEIQSKINSLPDLNLHAITYLNNLDGVVMWENPNAHLDNFKGKLTLHNETISLSISNLFLRGTTLRNTEYIYGIVVFTGEDTKIRRNCNFSSANVKIKSYVSKKLEQFMGSMVLIQIILCVFAGIMASSYYERFSTDSSYLGYSQIKDSIALEGLIRTFNWIIILVQLIPISLLVSTELVKVGQSLFMRWDYSMYDSRTGKRCLVQNSVLNEDLGQVEYIFSDKTGTFTQNKMDFKAALIGSNIYGSYETDISRRVKEKIYVNSMQSVDDVITHPYNISELEIELKPVSHFKNNARERAPWTELLSSRIKISDNAIQSFSEEDRNKLINFLWQSSSESESINLKKFLLNLAASNTILPLFDDAQNKVILQATSPDELAFCEFAKFCGFELVSRSPLIVNIDKFGLSPNEKFVCDYLGTIEFNSKRKRAAVILRYNGRILFMLKGADSVVLPILEDFSFELLNKSLINMSESGLRTLVFAEADLPLSWWEYWKNDFIHASSLPEDSSESGHSKGSCSELCKICKVFDDMEKSVQLKYLGISALEDKLSELVPECIEDFLTANIKVWMLTGDKLETAKNIGVACNLIDPSMNEAIPRSIDVVGSWFNLIHDSGLLNKFFCFIDIHHTGFIHSSDLKICLKKLKAPISNATYKQLESATIFDQVKFDSFMKSSGITLFDSVICDIESGIKLALMSSQLHSSPISMVLDGKALSCLFPPPRTSAASVLPPSSDNVRFNPEDFIEVHEDHLQNNFTKHVDDDNSLDACRERRISYTLNSDELQAASIKDLVILSNTNPSIIENIHNVPNRLVSVDITAFDSEMVNESALQNGRDLFFNLAKLCKSVIACRLTPDQKALIVTETRKREGVLTLAIGDGANDELMIRCADIGVGILGLEGSAAARASDYAIGQFRFLHILLFVHGFWNYRRIYLLVYYIFYKSVVPATLNFLFGFYSGFSGQNFLPDALFLLYAILFTSMPVIIFSIFDQGLARDVLENNPILYFSVSKHSEFNFKTFTCQLILAAVHSSLSFFLTAFSFGLLGTDSFGKPVDFLGWSTAAYTSIVFVVNIQLVLSSRSLNIISVAGFVLSILAYFLSLIVLSTSSLSLLLYPVYYGVFIYYANQTSFWLTVLLVVFTCLVHSIFPSMNDIFHERNGLTNDEKAQLIKNDHHVVCKLKRNAHAPKLSNEDIEPTMYLASFISSLTSNKKK